MIKLTISHNVYLTPEQRSNLAGGKAVEAVGVSVPVWYLDGSTSEPAREVFGKYTLTNQTPDSYPVSLARGYKINLPQVPEGYKQPRRLTPDMLDEFTPAEVEEWNSQNPITPTGTDLLEPEEGGTRGMYFLHYGKTIESGRMIQVIHLVNIKPMDFLESSLSWR